MRVIFILLAMLLSLKLTHAAPQAVDNIKSPCEQTEENNQSLCSSENKSIKEPPITPDEKKGGVIKPPPPIEMVPQVDPEPPLADTKKRKN